MTTSASVRLATRDELPAAARALARAFEGDPVWEWIAPPSSHWERRASRWFEAEITARFDHGAEIWVDDQVNGAAVWTPPGRWRSAPTDILRIAVPSLVLLRQRLLRGLGTTLIMEKEHPRSPDHWYLALLGTDPAHQGTGVGSALLRAVLERCDQQGVPAYLESSKLSNVGYYERFGFQVTGGVAYKECPVQTTMWREPTERF